MQIYKSEMESGLAEMIQANASIAFAVKPTIKTLATHDVEETDKFKRLVASNGNTFGANPEQFDLFYMESILASVGWNENDDIFTREDTWAARYSIVDKPLNLNHIQTDIIGHVTASRSEDFEGNLIAEDTELKDLPEQFDVIVGSAIYKVWLSNENKQKQVDEVLASIENDEKFVSMECLFSNFDYSVMSAQGECSIVQRNEDTAFLTKHLRAYGGSGEYEGNKIGRCLRGYSFSGMGIVDNPGNKRSDITDYKHGWKTTASLDISGECIMSDTKIDTVSKTQYDEAKAELVKLRDAQAEAIEKEVASFKADISSLQDKNKSVAEKLENVSKLSAEKDEKIATLETEVAEAKATNEELSTKVSEMEAKAAKDSRVSQLVAAGLEVEKASELADKFATADDEMFAEVVELNKAAKKNNFEKKDDDDKKKDDKKKDEAKADSDETDNAEAAADVSEVEQAEADKEEVDLSVDSDDSTAKVRSVASDWIRSQLQSTASLKTDE